MASFKKSSPTTELPDGTLEELANDLLLDRLESYILDRKVVALIGQYLKRTSKRGGLFRDFERGISRPQCSVRSGTPSAEPV